MPRFPTLAAQSLPSLKELLPEIGEVADSWQIAAWFHYPNGRIVDTADGTTPAAPKDALNRRDDLLAAARRMRSTYEA